MQTTAVTAPRRAAAQGAYDRVFYSGMAIAMAAIVFVGFAPTFYLRAFFPGRITVAGAATLSPLAQLHGAIYTGWVLLFIVQTALVANRKVTVHRRLGVAGAFLAASMIVVGLFTAVTAARRGGSPPGTDPLQFLAVPFFDLVLFTGFIAAAISMRRNRETHKRLMLLAYVSIITAGVARLPGVLPYGPFVFFGLSLLLVVAGIIYDVTSRGRVHRVYLVGGAIIAASVPLRLMISGTHGWRSFAEFLTR